MSAPLRISPPAPPAAGNNSGDTFKSYLDRLIKMIPAEVVGIYMIGNGIIPDDQNMAMAIWAFVCLILVVIVRIIATKADEKYQPIAVIVAAVSFVIWVYSMGGPFAKYDLFIPYIGSLAVLVWTFLIPLFYKGQTIKELISGGASGVPQT